MHAYREGVVSAEQIHVSLLRALAEDENKAERAKHNLDLSLLDAVTWPDYLWDFLRMVGDPAGRYAAHLGPEPPVVRRLENSPVPRQQLSGSAPTSKIHAAPAVAMFW